MLCRENNLFYCLFENIKRLPLALLLLGIISAEVKTAEPEADWTFLVYTQANNSLCPFAQKNFNDMATIGSSKDLNILVQWHDPNHNGVWRYKINAGKMELDMHLPVNIDGNAAKDLVDSMNWAVSKYPAKKHALILWNHGIGILDPIWGNQSMGFARSSITQKNPRAHIEGVTYLENSTKKLTKKEIKKTGHRGILFNERTKTYMNNQTLSSALSAIKTTVLKNKNIDLLGMDACLMAMTEVCYQIRNYADYFVGSQEVELAFGWCYAPVVQHFANKPTALEAAQSIVHSYENLYKSRINFYSQSAVDLKVMDLLRDSIDLVVQKVMDCREIDQRKTAQALKQARSHTLQFSTASYVDLHSFFQELQRSFNNVNTSVQKDSPYNLAINALNNAVDIASKIIEQGVIANATGKSLSRAKGLSIYYPLNGPIDQSYMYTEFATDCGWNNLLLMTHGY